MGNLSEIIEAVKPSITENSGIVVIVVNEENIAIYTQNLYHSDYPSVIDILNKDYDNILRSN